MDKYDQDEHEKLIAQAIAEQEDLTDEILSKMQEVNYDINKCKEQLGVYLYPIQINLMSKMKHLYGNVINLQDIENDDYIADIIEDINLALIYIYFGKVISNNKDYNNKDLFHLYIPLIKAYSRDIENEKINVIRKLHKFHFHKENTNYRGKDLDDIAILDNDYICYKEEEEKYDFYNPEQKNPYIEDEGEGIFHICKIYEYIKAHYENLGSWAPSLSDFDNTFNIIDCFSEEKKQQIDSLLRQLNEQYFKMSYLSTWASPLGLPEEVYLFNRVYIEDDDAISFSKYNQPFFDVIEKWYKELKKIAPEIFSSLGIEVEKTYLLEDKILAFTSSVELSSSQISSNPPKKNTQLNTLSLEKMIEKLTTSSPNKEETKSPISLGTRTIKRN